MISKVTFLKFFILFFCVCRRNCLLISEKLCFFFLFQIVVTGAVGFGGTFREVKIALNSYEKSYYPFMIKIKNFLMEGTTGENPACQVCFFLFCFRKTGAVGFRFFFW